MKKQILVGSVAMILTAIVCGQIRTNVKATISRESPVDVRIEIARAMAPRSMPCIQ
jgi:hypothetical protein